MSNTKLQEWFMVNMPVLVFIIMSGYITHTACHGAVLFSQRVEDVQSYNELIPSLHFIISFHNLYNICIRPSSFASFLGPVIF